MLRNIRRVIAADINTAVTEPRNTSAKAVKNSAFNAGRGDLAPRPEWSFYASYLIPYGSDETRYVRFYYDSIRFGQSPSKVTPLPRTVWQPESKADIVGLALGVRF